MINVNIHIVFIECKITEEEQKNKLFSPDQDYLPAYNFLEVFP